MSNFIFDPGAKFIDPEQILFAAGLSIGQTLADLGAGSGFYSFAAGKIVGDLGAVFAVDILEPTLEHIAAEARVKGLRNIHTVRADLEVAAAISNLTEGTSDVVLFANILHQIKNKKNLLTLAYRLLKSGGKLVVIEWNDQRGPLGPASTDRVNTSEVNQLASAATFKPAGMISTDPYHYGLIFIK